MNNGTVMAALARVNSIPRYPVSIVSIGIFRDEKHPRNMKIKMNPYSLRYLLTLSLLSIIR